jgi:ankyrin
MPLHVAAENGHEAVVLCLGKELGADINQADVKGATPLNIAAQSGHEAVVLCLAKELGADVNLAAHNRTTPLMVAASKKHERIIEILCNHGANPQAMFNNGSSTAADVSKAFGASAAQTAYLEARTHCSNPGCEGAGLKTCARCKQARYCCSGCQHAHWPAHRAECKVAAKARAAKGK